MSCSLDYEHKMAFSYLVDIALTLNNLEPELPWPWMTSTLSDLATGVSFVKLKVIHAMKARVYEREDNASPFPDFSLLKY